jgi:hypothetical protein
MPNIKALALWVFLKKIFSFGCHGNLLVGIKFFEQFLKVTTKGTLL